MTARSLQSSVPAAAAGITVVEWLVRRFTYFDAAAWRRELAAGRVQLDGRAAHGDERLHGGERLVYLPPEPVAAPAPHVPIVLQDERFVVVDKPAGLVAHAVGAFAQHTFVHELERCCGAALRFVHRLDRETSGLLLLAKDAATNASLQRQLADGTAAKCYLAVVRGVVQPDRFVVDAPIARSPRSTIAARRAVVAPDSPGARVARTAFEVVQRGAGRTLLRALPATGRTHQIRVHLEHFGHPVAGDVLYGRSDDDYLAWVRHVKAGGEPGRWPGRDAPRQLLHHARLTFRHPRTGDDLACEAGPPPDLRLDGQPG